MYVTDATNFQIDDVVIVHRLNIAATGVKTEISGRITAKDTGTDYIEIEVLATAPGAVTNDNTSSTSGLNVVHAGSMYAEGSRSRSGRYSFPSEIVNYTR
jgi:hypothetical protein